MSFKNFLILPFFFFVALALTAGCAHKDDESPSPSVQSTPSSLEESSTSDFTVQTYSTQKDERLVGRPYYSPTTKEIMVILSTQKTTRLIGISSKYEVQEYISIPQRTDVAHFFDNGNVFLLGPKVSFLTHSKGPYELSTVLTLTNGLGLGDEENLPYGTFENGAFIRELNGLTHLFSSDGIEVGAHTFFGAPDSRQLFPSPIQSTSERWKWEVVFLLKSEISSHNIFFYNQDGERTEKELKIPGIKTSDALESTILPTLPSGLTPIILRYENPDKEWTSALALATPNDLSHIDTCTPSIIFKSPDFKMREYGQLHGSPFVVELEDGTVVAKGYKSSGGNEHALLAFIDTKTGQNVIVDPQSELYDTKIFEFMALRSNRVIITTKSGFLIYDSHGKLLMNSSANVFSVHPPVELEDGTVVVMDQFSSEVDLVSQDLSLKNVRVSKTSEFNDTFSMIEGVFFPIAYDRSTALFADQSGNVQFVKSDATFHTIALAGFISTKPLVLADGRVAFVAGNKLQIVRPKF